MISLLHSYKYQMVDLGQSMADVVIPLHEYRQLHDQVNQLTRQHLEDGKLIVKLREKQQFLMAQLTKKHEEGAQLAKDVKELSRGSLRSMQGRIHKDEKLQRDIDRKEQEITYLCQERIKLQARIDEAEAEAIQFYTQKTHLEEAAEERTALIAIYQQRELEWQNGESRIALLKAEIDELKEAYAIKEKQMQVSMMKVMTMAAGYNENEHEISKSDILSQQSEQSSLIPLDSLSSTEPRLWERIFTSISSIRQDSSRYKLENQKLDLECKRLQKDLEKKQEDLEKIKLQLAERDSLHLSTVTRLEQAVRAGEAKIEELSREVSLASLELKKNASSRETKDYSESYKNSSGQNNTFELDESILAEKNRLQTSVHQLQKQIKNTKLLYQKQRYEHKALKKELKEKYKEKQKGGVGLQASLDTS